MSETSVIKQVPTQDLRAELRDFITSVSHGTGSQSELMKTGFNLLKNLPASRDAVLSYLGSIYEKVLADQLALLNEADISSLSENAALNELHGFLLGFVSSNSHTWALVISKWALELLGMFSSKYSSRFSAAYSLNVWLALQSTRSLIDIVLKCISCVLQTRNESTAVHNLLDTSVVHKPQFDWVVTTVGCHYPLVVIKRVFTWGLQDYLSTDANSNRPKLKSVVRILSSLSGCYSTEIQHVMTELLKWSLDKESELSDLPLDKSGVVPFLLQVSSQSSPLLTALGQQPLTVFDMKDVGEVVKYGERWNKVSGGRDLLLELTSHFILHTEDTAQAVLAVLFDCCLHPDPTVHAVTLEILELVVKEVDVMVRGNTGTPMFLQSLQKNISWLMPLLLRQPEKIYLTAASLVSLIGEQEVGVLSRCVAYLLLRSQNDDHLVSVVKFTQNCSSLQILSSAVSHCLTETLHVDLDESIDPKTLWKNLSKLLKWEGTATLVSLPMREAVRENVTRVGEELRAARDVAMAHLVADVLVRTLTDCGVGPRRHASLHQTLSIVHATISYFLLIITHTEEVEQIVGMKLVVGLVGRLCGTGVSARSMLIRELLESCLFKAPSVLFGARSNHHSALHYTDVSLLEENFKQGGWSVLGQKHSVLHAGVIESYRRGGGGGVALPPDKVLLNTGLLIEVIRSACHSESQPAFVDAIVSVALLLVELISPDVMYNGLPWPEEDFCKVTVERDLHIRRMLDQVPLVWSLLFYIAYYRPALCYCSVILRAVVGTLVGQWCSAGQQGRGAGHCSNLIAVTCKTLHVMTLGQLLPPPLSAISEAIPHLHPNQVVEVLKECVWNYMRDHVPSPALFCRDPNGVMWRDPSASSPPAQYTEPLRIALLANIHTLGPLYNTLFVHDNIDEE